MGKSSSAVKGIIFLLIALTALGCYTAAELKPDLGWAGLRVFFISIFWFFAFQGTRKTAAYSELNTKRRYMRLTLSVMMFVFAFFCLNLMLIDSLYRRIPVELGLSLSKWREHAKTALNLMPFETVKRYFYGWMAGNVAHRDAFMNLAGNFCIGMPFALFWPLLYDSQKKIFRFFITFSSCIIAVECIQFFAGTGTADIDDLILNAAGALTAFLVLHIPPIKKKIEELSSLPY